MQWDQITAISALGQFIVIAVAAVFAYLQLRDFGGQHEAGVIKHIFDELNSPRLSEALDFVYNHLADRLNDPSYVRTIADGAATVSTHTELVVMHFFNEVGLLVHERLISELIVPFIATPCMRSWNRLAPVVELMRRRYPHAYTPFESLVVRARAVDLSAINARFRSETPQLSAQWEQTARDLREKRITLLDDSNRPV